MAQDSVARTVKGSRAYRWHGLAVPGGGLAVDVVIVGGDRAEWALYSPARQETYAEGTVALTFGSAGWDAAQDRVAVMLHAVCPDGWARVDQGYRLIGRHAAWDWPGNGLDAVAVPSLARSESHAVTRCETCGHLRVQQTSWDGCDYSAPCAECYGVAVAV